MLSGRRQIVLVIVTILVFSILSVGTSLATNIRKTNVQRAVATEMAAENRLLATLVKGMTYVASCDNGGRYFIYNEAATADGVDIISGYVGNYATVIDIPASSGSTVGVQEGCVKIKITNDPSKTGEYLLEIYGKP